MLEQGKHQRYGRCLVERVIGRGARSTVYLAWHEAFQIPVAVKVMRKPGGEGDGQFSERFLREARIAAQLTHPNIVRVYDCGETEDSHYLVLEYIEGESCRDKLEQWGAFDWQRAVQIIRQTAEGLQYAAKKGIIHRDLKPENIMIDSDGNVRIADLGLAKEVVPGRSSATADGDVLGTPYYMSPEQIRQPSQVDFRSDVYSLGATLYHVATGQVPFEAPTPFEIMTMHLNEPLIHPHERRADLPEALCDIIVRCMAKDPNNRYQSYAELIKDLDDLLTTGPETELVETSAAVEAPAAPPPAAVVRAVATAEVGRPEHKPRPRPRPLRWIELPVTEANIQAKFYGMLALLSYAAFLVGLWHVLQQPMGAMGAVAVTLIVLGLSAGCAYGLLTLGTGDPYSDLPHVLETRISAAIGRMCERLNLPVPRVAISRSSVPLWSSYSVFSYSGTIRLPGGWLRAAKLTEVETEACIARCLAGVYEGDADFRTLLALPGVLIAGGEHLVTWLAHVPPGLPTRARARVAQGATVVLLLLVCFMASSLFIFSLWAGALGFMFLAVLALTAAFERHSRHVADSFAVKATEDAGAVKKLVVLSALARPEGYWFVCESMGQASAETLPRLPALPAHSRATVASAVSHFSEAEHVQDTLDLAMTLFSPLPPSGLRLNNLAGMPHPSSAAAAAVSTAGRVFSEMLGPQAKSGGSMAHLGHMGLHAGIGAGGGVLAVAALWLLFVSANQANYLAFLVAIGALSLATGLFVAPQVCREGLWAGRMGWACVFAASCFTCVSMLGICLLSQEDLSRFALQFPVTFMIALTLVAGGAVLYARLGAALGLEVGSWPSDAGSRTAYTVLMHSGATKSEEEETTAAINKARAFTRLERPTPTTAGRQAPPSPSEEERVAGPVRPSGSLTRSGRGSAGKQASVRADETSDDR